MSAPNDSLFAVDQSRRIPWWQPWAALALFSFALHFVWEMLQVPLYRTMSDLPHWVGIWKCTRASIGDVALTVAAYALVAVVRRSHAWIEAPRARDVMWYLGTAFALLAALELLSVHVWRRWSYADGMPTVLGIGIIPLLQWIAVPALTLWLVRRHLGLAHAAVSPSREGSS
jgi:hypothetical protein